MRDGNEIGLEITSVRSEQKFNKRRGEIKRVGEYKSSAIKNEMFLSAVSERRIAKSPRWKE